MGDTLAALDNQGNVFRRVLALDAPGCGRKRSRRTDDLSMAAVAQELIDDVTSAGLHNVVLVGHSQGGQAMSLMVELQPTLWRQLIYVSCSIPLAGQTVLEMMGNSVQGANPDEVGWPLDPATTSFEQRFAAMFCNDMSPDQAQQFLANLGSDMWPMAAYFHTDWRYDHLASIPSTYVRCLRDQSLPPAWQDVFAERFRVDRTVSIDAGHQVMVTRPDALAEVLRYEVSGPDRPPAV